MIKLKGVLCGSLIITIGVGLFFSNVFAKEEIAKDNLGIGSNDTVMTDVVKEPLIGFSSWYVEWPIGKEAISYLSNRDFVSTYNVPEAVLYKIELVVEPGKIEFRFPDEGIKTKDYRSRLKYNQVYTKDGYEYIASSDNENLLLDFLNVDISSRLKDFFELGEYRKNLLDITDGKIEQECYTENGIYSFREKKTFVGGLKVDYHNQLADMIESGELFKDVQGHKKFTEVEKNYLNRIVAKLRNKETSLKIDFEVFPKSFLDEDEYAEDKTYRLYSIIFTEQLKDGAEVKLRVEGLDKYDMHRDWYLLVSTTLDKNTLKTQEIADILGLKYNELVQILSSNEKLDKQEDKDGLIYYTVLSNERSDDFSGVIRVRWNDIRKVGLTSEE